MGAGEAVTEPEAPPLVYRVRITLKFLRPLDLAQKIVQTFRQWDPEWKSNALEFLMPQDRKETLQDGLAQYDRYIEDVQIDPYSLDLDDPAVKARDCFVTAYDLCKMEEKRE